MEKPIEKPIIDNGLSAFITGNLAGEYKGMNFPYTVPGQRKATALALTFWKYLRGLNASDVQKRREEIFSLMKTETQLMSSPLIKVVAMIETLPASVWRQLLWKENIDFVSFEALLRRLDSKQTAAIVDNYAKLFGHWDNEENAHSPQIPPVFKKGLRNRLKVFFGRVTTKKLLREKYDYVKRHQSKGAWAFNLLGLDFGFSLYPKGENNDVKITNQNFTRFLSIKEHINDFIVNQESGKYWWLYRTARSNFAFWPKKKIELKSHICPGFWATFLTHLIFWIVSPLGFVSTVIWAIQSNGSYIALLPLILSLPMILWIVVAFCRLFIKGIEKLPKKLQIIPQVIGIAFIIGILMFFAGFLIYSAGCLIYFLAPILGSLLSVLLSLTIVFYSFFFFTCVVPSSPLFDYKDIPKFVRFLLHFTLVAVAVILFDKYLAAAVIAGIVTLAKGLWDWYTNDLLLSNWIILLLLFTAGFAYFYGLFVTDEKRFVRHQKLFSWMIKGFLTISVIIFGIIFLESGTFELLTDSLLPGAFLAFILLLLGSAIIMIDQANLDNIEDRSKTADFIFRAYDNLGGFASKSYISRIMKSKWLWTLEESCRLEVADKIIETSFYLFPHEPKERLAFIDMMASEDETPPIYAIWESSRLIRDFAYSYKELWSIVNMMVKDKRFEEAQAIIYSQRSLWERKKTKIANILANIALPFVAIWFGLVWLWTKLRQFSWTLKDIWSLFNERCPYVSRPKLLD